MDDKDSSQEVPLPIKVIGIVFNLKKPTKSDEPDDLYEEYDSQSTIDALAREIESFGFETVLLEQDEDLFSKLTTNPPDFVFNIAEGKDIYRGREAQIPSLLESLGIPYTGSDPVSLAISLDKYLTNVVLNYEGVPVPKMAHFRSRDDLVKAKELFVSENSTYIVKPRWEGSSKGVFHDSISKNAEELKRNVLRIFERYKQPAIAEVFLPGAEITAGVLGNDEETRVIGMMRISERTPSHSGTFLYTLDHKREWEERILYEGPQVLDAKVREQAASTALKAFRALELRDVARIDMRMDESGCLRVIDINPLPGLSPHYSDLPILYSLSGGNYHDLIFGILRSAFKRYGIHWVEG